MLSQSVKKYETEYNRICLQCRRPGFDPLDWEDPLEKEMATHSCILAWRISWIKSLVGYNPWGHKESDATKHTHTHTQTLN